MPYTPRPEIHDIDTRPRPLLSLAAATCADAFGWWIECRCTGPGCHGGGTHYPVRLLIERHRCAERRLLDVAARLRCKRCRSKPSALLLVEDMQRVPKPGMTLPGGAKPAMVIDLLPQLAARAMGASVALPVTPTTWLCPVTVDDLARDPVKRVQFNALFGVDVAGEA